MTTEAIAELQLQERLAAREALAKLLAKSLFEEWLRQNAHLLPGDATAEQAADAAFANPKPVTWAQP